MFTFVASITQGWVYTVHPLVQFGLAMIVPIIGLVLAFRYLKNR